MLRKCITYSLSASIALATLPMTGCENLPGTPKEQGAVIGGVGGAAAGAAVAKNNRLGGALIGGLLGAGGGYLGGASRDKHKNKDDDTAKADAKKAADRAKENPATGQDGRNATS